MQDDPREAPATPDALRTGAAAGVLAQDASGDARLRLPSRPTAHTWQRFARRQLLVVGAALTVAGAVFFVAANWQQMAPSTRLGLVAATMAAATLGGGVLGLGTLAGRVALVLGGALFGPLLAVYGQTYQTGADAWNLFAAWALVFTGHALLARHAAVWLGWLALIHLAFLLWVQQVLGTPLLEGSRALALGGLAGFDAVLVALAHRFLPRSEGRYLACAAAVLGLTLLTAVCLDMSVSDELTPERWPCAAALVAAWIAMARRYRRRAPDLFMLFALAASALTVASGHAAYFLFEILEVEELGLWIMGVLVCAEVWVLTRWLLYWHAVHGQVNGQVDLQVNGQVDGQTDGGAP